MVFALIAILFSSVGVTTPSVYGQIIEPITVTTDKEAYATGDTIMVSGEVRELLSGFPVAIQIISSNGAIVGIDQVDVGTDRTYSSEVIAGGNLWRTTGTYTVKVTYGSQDRVGETTFEFSATDLPTPPTEPVEPPTEPEQLVFAVPGGEGNDITYTITGGTITSITINEEGKSLIIELDTISDGELVITLPRALIDARNDDDTADDEFAVLVDDQQEDFEETKTATDRTLTIFFTEGTETIEIVGTFVIPEFGTIAVMVLAVAIIAIIAISSRTKLGIMVPKV